MNNTIRETINKAIDSCSMLQLTIHYGLGGELQIEMDPYIYGDDIMQYSFIWGYIPFNRVFYRLRCDSIIKASVSNKKFVIQNDAVYLYAIEEEHWNRVDGVMVYSQGLVERTTG